MYDKYLLCRDENGILLGLEEEEGEGGQGRGLLHYESSF